MPYPENMAIFIAMKKICLLILISFIAVSAVFAVDLNAVIDKAKDSSAYQSIENSYKSSKNRLKLSDLATKGAGVTAAVQHEQRADEIVSAFPSANLSVTLPEFAEDLSIKFNVAENQPLKDLENQPLKDAYLLQPGVSVSKVFNFSSKEMRNASKMSSDIQVESGYDKGIIQFENSVIDVIINIMTLEKNLATTEKNFNRTTDSYKDAIATGSLDEGSVADLNMKMNLATLESTVNSLESQLALLKSTFRNSFGFEYEEITSVRDADLSYEKSDSNTTVYVKYLALLDAQYNYKKAAGKTSALTVDGNLSYPMMFNQGSLYSHSLDADASVSYQVGNFSVSAKAETSLKDKKLSVPVITIAGGWGRNEVSDVNIDTLNLAVVTAQNDYDSAKRDFEQSQASLEADIASFKAELDQFYIKKDYHSRVYDYQKQLFDIGFVSEQAYQDAVDDCSMDAVDEMIYKLKAVKLENQIRMMNI